jgi:hypothetical protein
MVTAILPVASRQKVLEKCTVEMNCARKEHEEISEICKDSNAETVASFLIHVFSNNNTHNITLYVRHAETISVYIEKRICEPKLIKDFDHES